MAAVHRIRRCDRVACGDRTLDGLRQRRDDERVARMQLADDRPDGRGVSPEESNRVVAEMLAEVRAGKQTEAVDAEAPGVDEPLFDVA